MQNSTQRHPLQHHRLSLPMRRTQSYLGKKHDECVEIYTSSFLERERETERVQFKIVEYVSTSISKSKVNRQMPVSKSSNLCFADLPRVPLNEPYFFETVPSLFPSSKSKSWFVPRSGSPRVACGPTGSFYHLFPHIILCLVELDIFSAKCG